MRDAGHNDELDGDVGALRRWLALVDGDRFYDGSQRSFFKMPSQFEIFEALEAS